MLRISEQAFRSLENVQVARFERDIVEILHEEFAEHSRALGERGVAMLVRRTRDQAGEWGVYDEEAVCQLCALALAFGEEVMCDPDVANYLKAGGDVVSRIRELMDEMEATAQR